MCSGGDYAVLFRTKKASLTKSLSEYFTYVYWGSQSLYPFMYWSTLGRNYDVYLRLGMRYEAEVCTVVISMNRAFK